MSTHQSMISGWAHSERAAWALSAPKWKLLAYLTTGVAIGLIAGLAISGFAV
ncbi:MAG TPA: hypothetical protein VD978_17735 [Azospirillum sp.]|nr:hypothetical protein [Azospirillum sp.]